MGQKDILLKNYFTPDIFADAINAIVYDGKQVVTPERMNPIDIETQRVEDENGNVKTDTRLRDSAKVVEVDDAIYCLFAIEHQSVEDYTMPLITIVMYWKADKWNQPVSVKDMFDKNTVRWLEDNGLGGYIQDYRMHLFEPGALKEKDLEKFKTELKDVIAYVKYSKSTEALKEYNEKYKPDLTKSTVTLINELTNSNYVFIDGKERFNMCEAFEGIKAEGIEEGRKKELKDKYKSWVTLSNNLKKRGMSNPEIASLLGVPETELQDAFDMIKEEKNRENEYEREM